jgi:hypothetical protein
MMGWEDCRYRGDGHDLFQFVCVCMARPWRIMKKLREEFPKPRFQLVTSSGLRNRVLTTTLHVWPCASLCHNFVYRYLVDYLINAEHADVV